MAAPAANPVGTVNSFLLAVATVSRAIVNPPAGAVPILATLTMAR